MVKITDIKEIQKRLLAIAKTFHQICISENIPYCMIGGTMLGTIRHRGFIPWDDDMDFGVPRAYYQQLIEILERQLPENYRCLTYQHCKLIKYPFIKIEDCTTCIDDRALDCSLEEKIGLNIDVFPIDNCSKGGWRLWRVFLLQSLQTLFFVNSISNSSIKMKVKRVIMRLAPHDRTFFLTKLEHAMQNAGTGYVANLMGRCRMKEILEQSIFDFPQDYPFEDATFRGISEYNTFLTHFYGNYMQLPADTERLPHVENVYIR